MLVEEREEAEAAPKVRCAPRAWPFTRCKIGFGSELHGFWHFWHFLIFSSIRLTDERRRRLAMFGLFGHGPQLPEGFFRVSDELAIEADRSCASEPCLCSAIPENRAFLAKFSEPSFRMTNEKFSMTNFQFRLSALVAALPR